VRAFAASLALLAACAAFRDPLDGPRGFPSLDRTWSATDFRAAATEADRLSGNDTASLPRRSDPVFGRMVDTTVGEDALDQSHPLSLRTELTSTYMQSIQRIMKAYARAGPSFAPELRELAVAAFANGCGMLRVLASADAEAPDDHHGGYVMARSGLSQLTTGVLAMLHPRDGVPDGDRVRFAGVVADHLPDLMPLLPEGDRQSIRTQLDGLIARERNPAVRERLSGIP
jgi:hypothetical protein